VCGYCGVTTAPSRGYFTDNDGGFTAYVCICSDCNRPTYLLKYTGNNYEKTPMEMMGNNVDSLPNDVEELYGEARRATGVGAFTSAVLTCRKILMHISVSQGADEGLHFIEYVDFLSDNNFIPPNGKGWVDHIRKKSNEANHEINVMQEDEAMLLIQFTEMLLKFLYEFPQLLAVDEEPDEGEETEEA
jgi:hypothetical protein